MNDLDRDAVKKTEEGIAILSETSESLCRKNSFSSDFCNLGFRVEFAHFMCHTSNRIIYSSSAILISTMSLERVESKTFFSKWMKAGAKFYAAMEIKRNLMNFCAQWSVGVHTFNFEQCKNCLDDRKRINQSLVYEV